MFKRLNDHLPPVDRRFLSIKGRSKRFFSVVGSLLILVFSLTLLTNSSIRQHNGGITHALASQSYPPSGTAHYLYVFPDSYMYVYDIDNNYNLVYSTSLATPGVRGVTANAATSMLYISYGSATSNGSLMKYNLLTNSVVWTKKYPFGVDSMGITPDGSKIYMPGGEFSGSNRWYVLDTNTGNSIASIPAGTGPHNTIVSLNGQHVYLNGVKTPYLEVADTSTNKVTNKIGQLVSGGRPFTINGLETLSFTAATGLLGYQVNNIPTGQVLYTVHVNGFNENGSMAAPSHGISLSPDEKEIYLMDGEYAYVHVFDITGLPNSAPVQLANIKLSMPIAGRTESGCSLDCGKEGWVLHSTDGRYVFVGDSGDIIDTSTRQIVKNLSTLANSRKFLEIDWQNGTPSFTTTRYGLGYVTTPTPTPTPTSSVTPTPTNTPTPTPTPGAVIAQDTFQRANKTYWGIASDGNTWGGDANSKTVFSINNNTGKVSNGNTSYSAVLGPVATNAQVLFTGSVSRFSSTNVGAALRWTNGNNWYKAYINGSSLVVQKRVNGSFTTLGTAPFTATANTNYSVRFQIVGTTLSAKAWPTSGTEPANWMVTVTDSSFSSGYCGLRIQVQSGAVTTITSFQATAL